MIKPRTIADTIAALPRPDVRQLLAPPYKPPEKKGTCVGLAVESMRRHTSNEGFELFQGLQHAGYALAGHNLVTKSHTGKRWVQKRPDMTDVREILEFVQPSTVVVQDQREWEGMTAGAGFNDRERFRNIEVLRSRPDVFTVTVLKDAHQGPMFHRASAETMGCHAWIVYYNPRIVAHLAPFVRPQHLIRTWHTLDSSLVPPFLSGVARRGCLISGAVSSAYPLRQRLIQHHQELPHCDVLRHPGYRRDGCVTLQFLQMLGHCKVAICTSSIYGYCLRKFAEATACGCRVVTDLPTDEVVPDIDGNLYRVSPDISIKDMVELLHNLQATYDDDEQRHWAVEAQSRFDFRTEGLRLVFQIEHMRMNYDRE